MNGLKRSPTPRSLLCPWLADRGRAPREGWEPVPGRALRVREMAAVEEAPRCRRASARRPSPPAASGPAG